MIEQTSTGYADADRSIYAKSFGNFPHKQPYHAGMSRVYGAQLKDMDVRETMKDSYGIAPQTKALLTNTGGTGTAGNALIPVFLDPRIVDISRKFTPLTELVARVANNGTTADYIRVTAKGAATTDVEDAAQTDVSHTRARVSKTIKYLYSVGRVTGPADAAIPAFTLGGFNATGAGNVNGNPFSDASAPNAMQQEVLLAAKAMKELEENLIINGNATTSVGSGPNGSEFDGFVQLQGTTNRTNLAGADLTWDDVEDTIVIAFNAGGRPNLAVASPSAMSALRKIMIDTFRMAPSDNATELAFGISAKLTLHTMIGAVPVIPSMYLSDTAAARSVYFLDMDWIEMRVLLDMTFQELAQTNDSRKFMLKIYECLIVRAPEFNAFIANIA